MPHAFRLGLVVDLRRLLAFEPHEARRSRESAGVCRDRRAQRDDPAAEEAECRFGEVSLVWRHGWRVLGGD